MLLDDMGGSSIRSHARSRIRSYDHRSRDHSVIFEFLLADKDVSLALYLTLVLLPSKQSGIF